MPYCFYPVGHRSHALVNVTSRDDGASAYYALLTPSGYPDDIDVVRMDVVVVDESTLRVKVRKESAHLSNFFLKKTFAAFSLQIFDPVRKRYEVPTFKLEEEEEEEEDADATENLNIKNGKDRTFKYGIRLSKSSFGFQVYRVGGPIM